MRQRTIRSSFTLESHGIHSGKLSRATFKPGHVGSGIVFRIGKTAIPAHTRNVIEKNLCTALKKGAHEVTTVEHVMAALNAAGIDNIQIQLDSEEFPILDGSALPIFEAIQKVGIAKQASLKRVIQVLKTFEVRDGDKLVRLEPEQHSVFAFSTDFSSRGLPPQSFEFDMDKSAFAHEIAPARTFGFYTDRAMLSSKDLALGATMDNTLIFNAQGQAMNGLRFNNEIVRHKILDAIGDLYFCGYRIVGRYTGIKAGHSLNHRILLSLFADKSNYRIINRDLLHALTPRASVLQPSFPL